MLKFALLFAFVAVAAAGQLGPMANVEVPSDDVDPIPVDMDIAESHLKKMAKYGGHVTTFGYG